MLYSCNRQVKTTMYYKNVLITAINIPKDLYYISYLNIISKPNKKSILILNDIF